MKRFGYDIDLATPPCIGLVALQSDETIEQDFRRLIPADARLYVTRVPSAPEVSRETLAAMERHLPEAAGLLPPSVRFDAIGYGCTSGTSVIGQMRIADLVREGRASVEVSEPVSALIAACTTLGIRRLAFLSPYVEDVSDTLRGVLRENGIETPLFGSFDVAEEAKVARIDGASIISAAGALVRDGNGVDGLFLSCTNLQTLDVIGEIEHRIGLPVLSSNQVLAWHLGTLAGAPISGEGFGRLISVEG